MSSIANSVKKLGDRRHRQKPYKHRLPGHLSDFTQKFMGQKYKCLKPLNADKQHTKTRYQPTYEELKHQ